MPAWCNTYHTPMQSVRVDRDLPLEDATFFPQRMCYHTQDKGISQSALGMLVFPSLFGGPVLASPPALPDAPLRCAFSYRHSRCDKSPERKAHPNLRCTMRVSRSCHNSHSHKRYPLVAYSKDLGGTVLHCSSVYTRAFADPEV